MIVEVLDLLPIEDNYIEKLRLNTLWKYQKSN